MAGRTLNDPERRLSLFAVGDDEQNVYGFAGASVEYIRRFQADYDAKPAYLVANYRSTSNIIDAPNELIARATERMKKEHPIRIDETRRKAPPGGEWESLDPVIGGRVQVLTVDSSLSGQAEQVMQEMLRIAALDPEWSWSNAAIVARQWKLLHPVLAFCEANDIPAQCADQDPPQFWRLRETQRFAEWLSGHGVHPISRDEISAFLTAQPAGLWRDLLSDAAMEYRLECGEDPLPAMHLREWLADWSREVRRRQRGLLLTTAHRVKGLEFDHVAVLDGAWEERGEGEDIDAARRLYYVAMTRARKTLTLSHMNRAGSLIDTLSEIPSVLRRDAPRVSAISHKWERRYDTLTPADIDLGFAGRLPSTHPIHHVLAKIQPGDPLLLVHENNHWHLKSNGMTVGRLATKYTPPKGMRCVEARANAILVRLREDEENSYANSIRCDRWEMILPELVFAP